MAKELHVGHLRSIAQGDALSNCLEYVGHHVDRIRFLFFPFFFTPNFLYSHFLMRMCSHVGDFGTPMGMVVAHILNTPEYRENKGRLPCHMHLSYFTY